MKMSDDRTAAVCICIYPWWTQDGVDAVKWRAHVMRREMGWVTCIDTIDQPPDNGENRSDEDV